jgi:rubredoxin
MPPFSSSLLKCTHCGFVLEAFHRILPPSDVEKPDLLHLERVAGCKNQAQAILCPQCKQQDFERLPSLDIKK